MNIKKKIHIKHLFANLHRKGVGTVDIAILTDSNQCIEYSIEFRQKYITKWVARRMRSLFEPYFIDASTDIVVSKTLDELHPLYQYFSFIKQHLCFRLTAIDKKKIINRVYYFYTGKIMKRPSLKIVWKMTIERKKCPWINQEVEYMAQNKGSIIADRIRIMRLGLFYIVVKNYLYKFQPKSYRSISL